MRAKALCLAGLLLSNPAQASTWRCDSALVSQNDSSTEVQHKCGEPNERVFIDYRQKTDIYGFSHELRIEEWHYEQPGGMHYFLRFEGNHLQ